MSARNPGAPSWSGRSITVIEGKLLLVPLIGLLAVSAGPGRADPFLDRLSLDAEQRRLLSRDCGGDRLCVARRLVAERPDRYRLIEVATPDTDTIRWVRNRPSILAVSRLGEGRAVVRLGRFGRRLLAEFRDRLPRGTAVLLDLRWHDGGDFGRMLQLARALLGERLVAPLLEADARRTPFPLPDTPRLDLRLEAVLIGPGTASSAEVLAALALRAGVPLCGGRSRGKDWLEEVVPVRQGWRLLVRRGRILVPGVVLAGGLRPAGDARCPVAVPG